MSRRDRDQTIILVIAFAVLAAVGPLAFWLGGNLVGFLYILAALGLLGFLAQRGDRSGGRVEVAPAPDDAHRTLVIADPDADAGRLTDGLPASGGEVRIIVPALTTRTSRFTGEVDEAIERAQTGADRLIRAVANSGSARVDGGVGDADPRKAVEDALRTFSADRILVLPPSAEDREFFSVSGPEEIFSGVRLPVTVLRGTDG